MERAQAKDWLENLLERLVQVENGWRLDGVVTAREHAALLVALAVLEDAPQIAAEAEPVAPTVASSGPAVSPTHDDGHLVQAEKSTPVPSLTSPTAVSSGRMPAARPARPKLRLSEERLGSEAKDDVRLCLDFGTARSKAFATKRGESSRQPLALRLGARAHDKTDFAVTSSLWISDQGIVSFGPRAIEQTNSSRVQDRKRIDSLKDALSQGHTEGGDIRDPAETLLDPKQNPTSVPMSEGDALLLYLAYLTDLAEAELAAAHGSSRFAPRRFAIPCWTTSRRRSGEAILRKYLAQAQVLADSLGGRWDEGFHVEDLHALLDEVRALPESSLPLHLITTGIPEPTAAAGSRVRRDDAQRGLVVVVDVGAGTTDFAAFMVREDPEKDLWRMWQLADGHGTNFAGNKLDSILMRVLVDQAHLDEEARRRAMNYVAPQARVLKENLFTLGSVQLTLPSDDPVGIDRETFLALDAVHKFARQLETVFDETLAEAKGLAGHLPSDTPLTVVATGGGASLPMVQALAGRRTHGFSLVRVGPFPARLPVELEKEYGQLAVAIGGAGDDVPDLRPPPGSVAIAQPHGVRATRGFGG